MDSVNFDRQTTTRTYSAATGRLLAESQSHGAQAAPATVVETSAAFVYDNAIMGATAPILGQRYRAALAPTLGDVSVLTASADYRRYFMPVRPFTIATRAEHVGRYGSGASDPRLLPLVWTVRDLVRGFGTDTNLLRTSQFDVANLELRFPLAGAFRRRVQYGAIPIEALAFADAGRFAAPDRLRIDARFLASTGAGIRINAADLVFEFTAAHPLTGDERGWRIGVNFSPGF
jgi:hypothetical protein